MNVPEQRPRTGSGAARQKWAMEFNRELCAVASYLRQGLELMRDLEVENDGVMKGLTSILRAKGNDVQGVIAVLEEEASNLVDPAPAPVVTESVNEIHAEAVAAAKAALPAEEFALEGA